MKPSKEIIKAAETVFLAMAYTETLRPIVEGYQRRIFEELGWHGYTQKNAYLVPDTVFEKWMARCNEERIKAHLDVDDPEKCPLLVAEHLQMQAERALIDLIEPITHINADDAICSGLDNYKKLIDLTLRWLAPYTSSAANILKAVAHAE